MAAVAKARSLWPRRCITRIFELASSQEVVKWDTDRNQVVSVIEKRVGTLVLESKQGAAMDEEKRLRVLCDHIRSQGLKILGWGRGAGALAGACYERTRVAP